MMNLGLFGMKTALFTYEAPQPKKIVPAVIDPSDRAILLLTAKGDDRDTAAVKPGDTVVAGQRIRVTQQPGYYAVATVAGKIVAVTDFLADFGVRYTAVHVAVKDIEGDLPEPLPKEPDLPAIRDFLGCAPGNPCMEAFLDDAEIETIVVVGVDQDLGVTSSQYIIQDRLADVVTGIATLKKITGVARVILTVPTTLLPGYGHVGAEILGLGNNYPCASSRLIAGRILGKEFPADRNFEDAGLTFMRAEAVASIGRAFSDGQIPFYKTLTVTDKKGLTRRMSVKIGTPVGDLLAQCRIPVEERDRIIYGGLLTGHAVPTLDMPVMPDTDAVHVQPHENLALSSNNPCINCGECVRICPTRVPVNMLVRFLEAGKYEDASDLYDLASCIECGLCSYVCVANIPILQYIKLAKHELAQMIAAEATDDE